MLSGSVAVRTIHGTSPEQVGTEVQVHYEVSLSGSGISASSVSDTARRSNVIKCQNDSEAKPVFRIGEKDGTSENPNDSAWDSTKRVVSFWMKGECASMNVQISASTGAKYVQYLFGTGTNGALSGGNAKVYLGYAAPEDWVRFERNVEADFEAYAGGGATWTNTDGLYISWPKSLLSYAFYVDDIRLSDSLTVEHNTLGPGVIGHILRHTTWDATTLARTDRWFHYDQVGSVLNESDQSGDDVTRHEQDAFGNVMQGWQSGLWMGGTAGQQLCGKLYDESVSALFEFRRWNDPKTGSYLSQSPLPTHRESRFVRVESLPISRIDPTGERSLWAYFGIPGLNVYEEAALLGGTFSEAFKAFDCTGNAFSDYHIYYKAAGWSPAQRDAMKHCSWSCCMAAAFGQKKAKRWGDAHEALKTGRNNEMDYHNNAVGRGLVKNGLVCKNDQSSCDDACESAMLRGGLIVNANTDPRLRNLK